MEGQDYFNGMKTLHITSWKEYPWEINEAASFLFAYTGRVPQTDIKVQNEKMRQLMKELYDLALKVKFKFNGTLQTVRTTFVTANQECLEKVKDHLTSKGIKHIEYDYPTPQQEIGEEKVSGEKRNMRYGEEPGGIVMKYPSLFLPVFHTHSVAAITMSDEDHHEYMERVVHTMWNPRLYTRLEEGQHLTKLAVYKAGVEGVDSILTQMILSAAKEK